MTRRPVCSRCDKAAPDHCRYMLCEHVLCVDCDLTHEQATCDRPNWWRKEMDALAKAQQAAGQSDSRDAGTAGGGA